MKTNFEKKSKPQKEKVIAAIATFLLFASLIGTGIYYDSNVNLKKSLNGERLKSETLLSEKLLLDKQISKFKSELASLKGKNEKIDKILAETEKKLLQKEKEVQYLTKDNGRVKSLEKQIASLNQLKKEFEGKISSLTMQMELLNKEKSEMMATITDLKKENAVLAGNIEIMKEMAADGYLIEPLKGNSTKLTARAKKTKQLKVSFDIPQDVAAEINFKIITPDKKVIDGSNKALTYHEMVNDGEVYASLSPVTGQLEITKRIQMSYKPEKALTKGTYKIEIFNKDKNLGNCKVRLN